MKGRQVSNQIPAREVAAMHRWVTQVADHAAAQPRGTRWVAAFGGSIRQLPSEGLDPAFDWTGTIVFEGGRPDEARRRARRSIAEEFGVR